MAEEICLENREGRKAAMVRILPAPPFFISAKVCFGIPLFFCFFYKKQLTMTTKSSNIILQRNVVKDGEKMKRVELIKYRGDKSQADMAKQYKVSQQAWSSWENGDKKPDVATMKQIERDSGIPMETLFFDVFNKR